MPVIIIVIPEKFRCFLTNKLFHEPVIAEDGYTYSKDAILQYLKLHNYTSPFSGQKMHVFFCIDFNKQRQINDFLQNNNICTFAKFIELVKNDDLNELKKLNYLPEYLEMTDEGITVLQLASSLNHTEVVNFLIEQGADTNALEQDPNSGFNP